MNTQEYQNVEIYLDYATIPSLNYFFHFVENYQDKDTIRLFGLGRFAISQKVTSKFPEGKIFFETAKVGEQDKFNQVFYNIVSNAKNKLRVNLHLNLFHSLQMLVPLLRIYFKFKDQFKSFHLFFYDDGSEGCATLYSLNKNDKLDHIVYNQKQKLVEFKDTLNLNILNNDVLRYLWNNVLPSHYYLLETSLLEKHNLSSLKQEGLTGNVSKISFGNYAHFNDEQKSLLFDMLGIDHNLENQIHHILGSHKTFLFTGTTIFDSNDETDSLLAKMHINAINYFINKNIDDFEENYLFLYKGHPNAEKINKFVRDTFKNMIFIPSELSFEILYLLGLRPTKMGGFASSSYFNLNSDMISDLIFLSSPHEQERQKNRLFNIQYELAEVLKELGYIENKQIHYYQQFM